MISKRAPLRYKRGLLPPLFFSRDYDNKIDPIATSSDPGYKRVVTSSDSGYKRVVTSSDSGYKRVVTSSDPGYKRVVTSLLSGQ